MALQVEDEDVRAQLIGPFARQLRGLVRDEAVAIGVRRAAATSLTISSTEADAGALVQIVREINSSELVYELLGAMRSVVGELQPGSPTAELVQKAVFRPKDILQSPATDFWCPPAARSPLHFT